MVNNLDKYKKTILLITSLLIILHPIIELDYIAYPWLNSFNLPRLTTIVNFIFYPLLALFTFTLFEKNKRKTVIILSIYLLLLSLYFVLHCRNAIEVIDLSFLPNNYAFSYYDEFFYVVTLLIPIFYIWVFYKQEITEDTIKTVSVCSSVLISIPIFLSNIFLFGLSTYEGNTIANFISWFSLPYNSTTNKPRFYASKFFFEEGNTIGILLILILPFIYYFFYKERNKKNKILLGLLILVQSLSMIILSTRVSTFGAALIPLAMLTIYLILIPLKYEKFNKAYLVFSIMMVLLSSAFIPFCPAVNNQLVDNDAYLLQKTNNAEIKALEPEYRQKTSLLEKRSKEWYDYYTRFFEDHSYLIKVTPPVYYTKWYSYKHDPQFWCDLIFNYKLEERIDGRQIQNIFTHYKYDYLPTYNKLFGMGYSSFMNGGIMIEKDFVFQYYCFGILGFMLLVFPWFAIVLYLAIKLILGYKNKKWTYINITLMMSICIGLVAAFVSGHTIDQLSTSMFISLCSAMLLLKLKN